VKFPKDENSGEFQFRPGSQIFGDGAWLGVNTQDDPGSLKPNELQRGENIRLAGKNIKGRTGNTPLTTLPNLGSVGPVKAGQVMWLKEAPADNPHIRLWFSTLGCLGAGIGTGGTIFSIDQSQSPQVQIYARFFASTDRTVYLASYSDAIFAGDKTALRGLVLLSAPTGVDMNTFAPSPPSTPYAVFTGYTISCMKEFDGKLFVGLSNDATPAASKIIVWNGLSWQDDLTGIRPPLCMGTWQSKLVVGFDATAGHIRTRVPGAAPGTWTTVALGGFKCAPFGNAIMEVGPKTYIASGDRQLYQYDGTTLSLATTVASADNVGGRGVCALCKHQNLLYYGWNEVSPWKSWIGRHDPDNTFSAATEWVDAYKDISNDAALVAFDGGTFRRLTAMESYRQNIFVGGSRYWIAATADNDVKGNMRVVYPGSSSAGFEVQQLLRF
jgi:hypothetical protein